MEQYAVFAGEDYYPRGGWSDFCGEAKTIELAREVRDRAIAIVKNPSGQWWQIVDIHAGNVVEADDGWPVDGRFTKAFGVA